MPYKTLKNLALEIVLFITIVSLAGHVTVNLWERYVVQNELCNMKNSLQHLKVTVHNIGDAYDDLQRDLIDLARINSKPSITPNEIISCKKTKALDQKILQNLQILLMKINDKTRPLHITDKNTGSVHINKNLAKNATTITRYPMKATGVGSGPYKYPLKSEFTSMYNCTKNNIQKCEDCDICIGTHKIKCLEI